MEPLRVRVVETGLYIQECRTRMPFRFGAALMTWAPMLTAHVLVEDPRGRRQEGFSADLLVPHWFDKDPNKSFRQNVTDLIESAKQAAEFAAADRTAQSVFDLWYGVHARQFMKRIDSADPSGALPLLVRGFGVALLERAVMDAACRFAGVSFFEALRSDLFAFQPGRIHPELAEWKLERSLRDKPLRSIHVRHTVGLADPLRAAEISPERRVNDGLPEALDEVIAANGLTHFKIKLSGDVEHDFERLLAVQSVVWKALDDPFLTFDGNEQYDCSSDLVSLLARLVRRQEGRNILNSLRYIEQPFKRERLMEAVDSSAMRNLTRIAPVIIDEADDDIAAFPAAIEAGFGGVSVKNCKGVFRALLNRGLCEFHTRRGRVCLQTSEDLTNLAVLPLQQDLATIAALGLTNAERNGHHYFHGLDHLPHAEARAAAAAHPDLYCAEERGVFARIEKGRMEIGSLQCVGYGYDGPISTERRTPVDQWHFPDA